MKALHHPLTNFTTSLIQLLISLTALADFASIPPKSVSLQIKLGFDPFKVGLDNH